MRRRQRRVLLNVFAFSLLAVAIYLNMFRTQDENIPSYKNTRSVVKTTEKPGTPSKINGKEIHRN